MNYFHFVNRFLDGGYSHRMQRLAKRNARKSPEKFKVRECSRCDESYLTAKDARRHFREAHGFQCMEG